MYCIVPIKKIETRGVKIKLEILLDRNMQLPIFIIMAL